MQVRGNAGAFYRLLVSFIAEPRSSPSLIDAGVFLFELFSQPVWRKLPFFRVQGTVGA